MAKSGYDKGKETDKMHGKLMAMNMNEKPVHYPSILSLDEGDLPELKDWKVGETYKIELTVKQIASSVSESGMMPANDSDKDKVHARFEVIKAETDENDGADEGKENEKEGD